jgi:hypothetical protein
MYSQHRVGQGKKEASSPVVEIFCKSVGPGVTTIKRILLQYDGGRRVHHQVKLF